MFTAVRKCRRQGIFNLLFRPLVGDSSATLWQTTWSFARQRSLIFINPLTTSEVYSLSKSIGTFHIMVLLFVRFVFGSFLVRKSCRCTSKTRGVGGSNTRWEKNKKRWPVIGCPRHSKLPPCKYFGTVKPRQRTAPT